MSRIRHLFTLSIFMLFLPAGLQLAAAQTQPASDQTVETLRAELLYGHIAVMQAQNDAVKDLAEAIIRNDAKALQVFQGPENPEGFREKPSSYALTDEQMREMTRLSELSGSEFDRTYVQSVIQTRQNVIHLLEQNPDVPSPLRTALDGDILPSMRQDLLEARTTLSHLTH